MQVFGASVSYFTGKLEAYLRYKGIPYERLAIYAHEDEIRRELGALQHPVVRLDDGRWMSDTTPMIAWLESQQPEPAVMPVDPAVRFLALLIEDYADEWLWRPAMHYRWSYEPDREILSRLITDDQLRSVWYPRFVKLRLVKLRQRIGFVVRDGVNRRTRAHVEGGYHAALSSMSAMLAERPFLLGETPSIADFGLMGPMLRHFGQDPTPAEIMRNEAPAVFEWVARMWNARAAGTAPCFVDAFPADGAALLREIAETHLVQLAANAEAVGCGKRRFAMTVQGCAYAALPVSAYRVACLAQLRAAFAALPDAAQTEVRGQLDRSEAEVLWKPMALPDSGHDPEGRAPFGRGSNVYAGGVPLR